MLGAHLGWPRGRSPLLRYLSEGCCWPGMVLLWKRAPRKLHFNTWRVGDVPLGRFLLRACPQQVGWADLGCRAVLVWSGKDGRQRLSCPLWHHCWAIKRKKSNFFGHHFRSWNSLMAYRTKGWKIRVIIRFLSVPGVLCFPLEPCWYAALTSWTAGSKNTPPFFFWWRLSLRRINIIDWGI